MPALLLLFLLLTSPCTVLATDCARMPLVLDVGHSEATVGAVSARGKSEYSFNVQLTQRIQQALLERGCSSVYLLDSGSSARSPQHRTRLAQEHDAVLLLSVHHDSVQPHYLQPWIHEGRKLRFCNRFQGYSLFYSEKNPQAGASLQLAREIGSALRLAGFTPSAHHAEPIPGENRDFVDPERGIYRFDDLLVLKTARMPAVLLEAGIIVNSIEERALLNPVRQKRMAEAIAGGIARFLGLASPQTRPVPLR